MAILCCCPSGQSNPSLDTGPAPVVLAPVSIADPDVAPTSPGHLFEGWFSSISYSFHFHSILGDLIEKLIASLYLSSNRLKLCSIFTSTFF